MRSRATGTALLVFVVLALAARADERPLGDPRLLLEGPGPVMALAFRPGTGELAAGRGDALLETVLIPPEGGAAKPFAGHFRTVHALAWSPDGTLVAAAGPGRVSLLSGMSRRLVAILATETPDEERSFYAVHFSADGAAIIAAGGAHDAGEVHQFDLPSLAARRLLVLPGDPAGGDSRVYGLAETPGGELLAGATGDLFALDPASGEIRRRIDLPPVFHRDMGLSNRGDRLFLSTWEDAGAESGELETGPTVVDFPGGSVRRLAGVAEVTADRGAISPGGRWGVLGTREGEILVFDLASGRLVQRARIGSPVTALAFAADGASLAAGTVYGEIHLFPLSPADPGPPGAPSPSPAVLPAPDLPPASDLSGEGRARVRVEDRWVEAFDEGGRPAIGPAALFLPALEAEGGDRAALVLDYLTEWGEKGETLRASGLPRAEAEPLARYLAEQSAIEDEAVPVSLEDLFADPARFDGKKIRLAGVRAAVEFEGNTLSLAGSDRTFWHTLGGDTGTFEVAAEGILLARPGLRYGHMGLNDGVWVVTREIERKAVEGR
ncbi:MAG: hypothetical protein HY720_13390 [Planctomycetes bacterium]|nr:hypothetical protein [Planctomycetota bacterium]